MAESENNRALILVIFGSFIAVSFLLSALTGTNPIESVFALCGQIIMYMAMLLFFGMPVFMLAALFTIAWREITQKDNE